MARPLFTPPVIRLLAGALAALMLRPAFTEASVRQKSRAPCSAPEYHQWDFWLGNWRVTDLHGAFQGTNEIKAAPGGCGLIENWIGAEGGRGTSFNGYDSVRRTWTQFWLSSGSVIRLEGNLDSHGVMRTAGTITYNARRILHPFRGVWTPLLGGAVKQEFYEYDPGTKLWHEWFTGIYRHPDEPAKQSG